ncbi:MAG: nucleoside triphosphate pyrophosphohydrolase [Spirochaeta sp.]
MNSKNTPLLPPGSEIPGFDRLCTIVRQLRSPDGCPWDRKQTPESLRAATIEEAYEVVDAINDGDTAHIREELGDIYLMITMIAVIYQEQGEIEIDDILHEVCEKLIRRHPHVYGDAVAEDSAAVALQWEEIKEQIEGRVKDSVLDKVSHALPPLERAYQLQKTAARHGFDWTEAEPVWDKISEELAETREAWVSREQQSQSGMNHRHLEEELGDLLFSVVNVARYLKIDPAIALQQSNAKFNRRFRFVEKAMIEQGKVMSPETFTEMDALWDAAKQQE